MDEFERLLTEALDRRAAIGDLSAEQRAQARSRLLDELVASNYGKAYWSARRQRDAIRQEMLASKEA